MRKGFTLLELMATIAIVAILTFAASLAYQDYLNHTKMTQAAEFLQGLNNAAIQAANEQSLGSTFSFDGNSYSTSPTTVDYPPVTQVTYYPPSYFSGTNVWMFCANVADLKFSGYVLNGAHSRLCSKVEADAGVYKTYCGSWDNSSGEIPAEQLPAECNCASISTNAC